MSAARVVAAFWDRDFEPVVPPVKFLPTRYSWSAVGGPRQAELEGTGDVDSIWACVDMLRYECRMVDENARDVWWGYVAEVQIDTGVYSFGITLDSMANRIAVAYTRIEAGGTSSSTRATTLWSMNAESVAEFGIKEALLTLSNATDDAADRYRDAALSLGKIPVPTFSVGEGTTPRVTLVCRGWWDTLRWRYPAMLPDGLSMVPNNTTTYDHLGSIIYLGSDPATRLKIGQSFKTGSYGFSIYSVELKVSKNGTPQPLKVGIYSADQTYVDPLTSPGQPGTPIGGYGTIDQSQVGEGVGQWVTVAIPPIDLAANTWYWLVAEMAGDPTGYDNGDHWNLGITYHSESAYPQPPAVQMYYDHSWATYVRYTLTVKTHGSRDTTQLISDTVQQVGQFFVGTIWDERSQVSEAAYADGDMNAEEYILSLMGMGTYYSPRLLASVTPERVLYLFPEPQKSSTPTYMVDSNGHFFTGLGAEIPAHFCPCGGWLEIKDAIPQIARSSKIINPSVMFIEEAEYNVASGRLSITPRGIPTVWDLGGS